MNYPLRFSTLYITHSLLGSSYIEYKARKKIFCCRVFVGGISSTTTESELHQLFSAFGNVKQTKIIQDRAGLSKGYGFVTFETEEEARRLQVQADNIVLKERKLNIAPAIKKQVTDL